MAPILIVNGRHPYKSRTPDRVVVPLAQPYKADMLTRNLRNLTACSSLLVLDEYE